METQEKPLFHRILSLSLSLILFITMLITALPVSADDHNHEHIDLEATYGPLIEIAAQGESNYKMAFEVLNKVNAERKKAGLKPLEMDKTMLECAMQRAAECAVYYSHTRPNGEFCFTIIKNHEGAAENVAAGYTSAADVMNGWMNSPGHKQNILTAEFQSIGIGCFKIGDYIYWCQLFNGSKKQANPTQKKPVTETRTIQARTKLLDLSINTTDLTLKAGASATLQITNCNLGFPYDNDALAPSGFNYVPADTGIVAISEAGVVTPIGDGTTTIDVQSKNGVSLFKVSVTAENKKITATLASNGGKPRIIWNKVTGATSYRVYKSVYSGGKWSDSELLKKAKTVFSCTDKNIASGTKVRYKLYAYNGSKRMEGGATLITTYLDQPTIQVANSDKGVKVTWNKVTGASYYKVYRSVYKNSKWSDYTYYKSTKTLEYTDTKVKSGDKVRYTVYACYSDYQSAYKTGKSILYLGQPKVKLTKATKGVKVTWGKVTGATYYKVYRSVYKNGKWSAYTAVKDTKTTSFSDTSVKAKQKVRYTVYAVNGSYKSAAKTGVIITR